MKRKTILPSREVLCQIFSYDPDTGELKWKERPRNLFRTNREWIDFNRKWPGKPAGYKAYVRGGIPSRIDVRFKIHGTQFIANAAILAFSVHCSDVPHEMIVDHQDNNPFNNQWTNLRLATDDQNGRNRIAKRNGKTGLKGVYVGKSGYESSIMFKGKKFHLGTFRTPEEAHQAYKNESERLHGEFSRT